MPFQLIALENSQENVSCPHCQHAVINLDEEQYIQPCEHTLFIAMDLGFEFIADDFAHEQSVVFETGKGLVIFNSCSHGGIVNIVREVQMALGGQKVYAVVGGFHMMKLSGMDTLAIPEEEVVETAQELKGLGVEEIYTGHCTGNIAFGILKKELGEMVHALGTGETVVF